MALFLLVTKSSPPSGGGSENNAMIKTRNKLQKEKGLVLLSAGLNIRILKTAKKEIIEAAADFYPDSDEESDYEGADEADE